MKPSPATARVLIAAENASDGNQLQNSLQDHFENLRISTNSDSSVQDFEDFKPAVVVLAFDCIDKAQRYSLGLYRLSPVVQQHPHRTILLCAKPELSTAFELCKKRYFDDYVLYWPHAYEGLRLPMSIWLASREVLAARATSPPRAELLAHVKHLGDLEATLGRELCAATEPAAAAHADIDRLERQLSNATDDFSQRVLKDGAGGTVEVKDASALSREIEQMRRQQAVQTQVLRDRTLTQITSWARDVMTGVAPALAGTRVLVERVRKLHPVIMVVDDDELTRELLARALDSDSYEVIFASDSVDALNELRQLRPDVILMDIRLPGVDGVSFTRHLKATPHLSSIPIIMMTGDASRERLVSSIEAGAADFIVKPFRRESLKAKIDKLLSL
jgi:CheY-like chemotaxis protein/peptidyl-tRNA hydrolase